MVAYNRSDVFSRFRSNFGDFLPLFLLIFTFFLGKVIIALKLPLIDRNSIEILSIKINFQISTAFFREIGH